MPALERSSESGRTENWEAVDRAVKAFEDAWRTGQNPAIKDYLPTDPMARLPALVELIHVDLERRLATKEGVRLEFYFKRFPELAGEPEQVASLIAAEFAHRNRRDARVKPDEYLRRFPALRKEIEQRLAARSQGDETIDGANTAMPDAGATKAPTTGPSITPDLMGAADRYFMGTEIARGGMGAVLKAKDREIRREVAVKYLLDQDDQSKKLRFIEEAQITGQLEHPNIVPVHELGIDRRFGMFFSMKMVQGRSLAQVLTLLKTDPDGGAKAYPLRRLLNGFVAVCNAMAYAHSRGVVHRDLKPANIMLGDFGEIYVMDWGLAKVLDRGEFGMPAAVPVAAADVSSGPVPYVPRSLPPQSPPWPRTRKHFA